MKELRKRFAQEKIVVFGDNFHLYANPQSKEEGEAKTRGLSMACKNIANVHHVTMIMTMELPKSALEEGKRPRMSNIKGSAGISYDSSANIGVYNDMKDLRNKAELYWFEDLAAPLKTAPGVFESRIKSPILELVFDKSKVNTGFDGQIYYYFHPASGQVWEVEAEKQSGYQEIAYNQQNFRDRGQYQGTRPVEQGQQMVEVPMPRTPAKPAVQMVPLTVTPGLDSAAGTEEDPSPLLDDEYDAWDLSEEEAAEFAVAS